MMSNDKHVETLSTMYGILHGIAQGAAVKPTATASILTVARLATIAANEALDQRPILQQRIRDLEAEVSRLKAAASSVVDWRKAHSTTLDYALDIAIDNLHDLVRTKEEV